MKLVFGYESLEKERNHDSGAVFMCVCRENERKKNGEGGGVGVVMWGKKDTSVSISADSTSILTSAMILMISTSNPGRSAVSI